MTLVTTMMCRPRWDINVLSHSVAEFQTRIQSLN